MKCFLLRERCPESIWGIWSQGLATKDIYPEGNYLSGQSVNLLTFWNLSKFLISQLSKLRGKKTCFLYFLVSFCVLSVKYNY